jgi:hypothetical protein
MKRRGWRRTDTNLALFALCRALRGFDGALDSRQDVARRLQQRVSGIGQFNTARLPAKQLHTEFSFKRLDRSAERGLLHIEALGGPRDVTFLGGHGKIAQAPEFHCHTRSVSNFLISHHT